jgi:hypothetical protein
VPEEYNAPLQQGFQTVINHEYFGSIYPASDWNVIIGGSAAALGTSRV